MSRILRVVLISIAFILPAILIKISGFEEIALQSVFDHPAWILTLLPGIWMLGKHLLNSILHIRMSQ